MNNHLQRKFRLRWNTSRFLIDGYDFCHLVHCVTKSARRLSGRDRHVYACKKVVGLTNLGPSGRARGTSDPIYGSPLDVGLDFRVRARDAFEVKNEKLNVPECTLFGDRLERWWDVDTDEREADDSEAEGAE